MYGARYSCQILRNLNFLKGFSKNTEISNIVKFRPVEAELFHADGQDRRIDRQKDGRTDMTKQTVAIRNFASAPKSHG